MKYSRPAQIYRLFRVICLCTTLLFAQSAYARDYVVELIIFERLDADRSSEEKWSFTNERIIGKLQQMRNLESKAVRFNTSPSLNHLARVKQNLTSTGFRILRTAKWTQPSAVYQNAPLISFGAASTTLPFGFVRIYKTSLIFADVDLQLSPVVQEPVEVVSASSNLAESPESLYTNFEYQQPHFFISEKRRLKFKEVHYFDHPRFGVILGVWPGS